MRLWVAMMFWLAAIGQAGAQEPGQVGITMGYPAAVGIVWHVSGGIALRPEVSFSRNTNEFLGSSSITFGSGSGQTITTTTSTENTNNQVGVGLSALFYLRKWEGLRVYVSPRVLYSRGTNRSVSMSSASLPAVVAPSSTTTETTNSAYFASGSFGAQYALSRRFGLYGEVGLGFNRSVTSGLPFGRTETTSTSAGTRSGVGAIFYF